MNLIQQSGQVAQLVVSPASATASGPTLRSSGGLGWGAGSRGLGCDGREGRGVGLAGLGWLGGGLGQRMKVGKGGWGWSRRFGVGERGERKFAWGREDREKMRRKGGESEAGKE
ncbi:unnamed protein product [Sphenostylis stenocarpa]|uniref:Uncharacterized protein n=1 Tax=Sphenostylis stenocarpa TaxID=92480 RepID=A0AA86VCR3_9FABA|nr:unnamed protein product [Sphenostylis stenocarpa]